MHSVSIRVALAATAIVAIIYFVIAAGVVAITTRNLTAQVDARLADAINHVTHDPGRAPNGPPPGAGGGAGGNGGATAGGAGDDS